MRVTIFIFLILCLEAYAQQIKFKLSDGTEMQGVIVKDSWDEDGFYFIPEGMKIEVWIHWKEIWEKDAISLKRRFLGIKVTPPIKKELMLMGVRIVLKDGRIYQGLIEEETPKRILLKNVKGKILIDKQQIQRRISVNLDWFDIYTPQQIYQKLATPTPKTPEDYEALSQELLKYGLKQKAQMAYRLAQILRQPAYPEHNLYSYVLRLSDILSKNTFYKLIYVLQERLPKDDYETVIKVVKQAEAELKKTPERQHYLQQMKLIRTQLNLLRDISKEDKIISEWQRVIDSLIMTKALDRTITYKSVIDYIEKKMANETVKIIKSKFNLAGNIISIWQSRLTKGSYYLSYDSSTWLIESPDLYDAEKWWRDANSRERFNYLKGVFVERFFHVKKIIYKNCSLCGGTGRADSRYLGRCPTCMGLRKIRVIIYN